MSEIFPQTDSFPFGQQTVWQFENIERNQPLADSLFEFEPPADIEVIENTYAQ